MFNQESKKKYRYTTIICWVVVVIPRIICILFFSYPLQIPHEELFIFAVPAKLAGLDWSNAMYNYRYYGYGFSVFLTPLFCFIDNPIWLYKVILCFVTLIEGAIPIIGCNLLKKIATSINTIHKIFIVVICSYAVIVGATVMYNERIYVVCVWVAFWLIAQIMGETATKKIGLYSLLLGLVFSYSLMLHKRAVTLIIAFCITYVFFRFIGKIRIAKLPYVLIPYLVTIFVDKQICNWLYRLILGNEIAENTTITNTEVPIALSKSLLTNQDLQGAVLKVIFGQLLHFDIFTGGLAIFTLVLGVRLIIQICKGKKTNLVLLVFGFFGICCCFISIVGQATSWGWGVMEAFQNNDSFHDSLRAMSYLRYLMAYYPPVLMLILVYIVENPKAYLKDYRLSFGCMILLSGIWVKRVVPLIMNNSAIIYKPLAGITFNVEYVFASDYFNVLLIYIFFSIGFYLCIKNHKKSIALSCLCFYILYAYFFNIFEYRYPAEKLHYEHVNASVEMINLIKKENIQCKIYRLNMWLDETKQSMFHELQFMCPQTEIIIGIPENSEDNVFVFTNSDEASRGYNVYKLDENEYVWIKGKDVEAFCERMDLLCLNEDESKYEE